MDVTKNIRVIKLNYNGVALHCWSCAKGWKTARILRARVCTHRTFAVPSVPLVVIASPTLSRSLSVLTEIIARVHKVKK